MDSIVKEVEVINQEGKLEILYPKINLPNELIEFFMSRMFLNDRSIKLILVK